jgi:hypothetical protein
MLQFQKGMYFYYTWSCIEEHEYDVPGHRTIVVVKSVDGFLRGCRPYLAIDNTLLTGMIKG